MGLSSIALLGLAILLCSIASVLLVLHHEQNVLNVQSGKDTNLKLDAIDKNKKAKSRPGHGSNASPKAKSRPGHGSNASPKAKPTDVVKKVVAKPAPEKNKEKPTQPVSAKQVPVKAAPVPVPVPVKTSIEEVVDPVKAVIEVSKTTIDKKQVEPSKSSSDTSKQSTSSASPNISVPGSTSEAQSLKSPSSLGEDKERGKLVCLGKPVDSEVIYWKESASDKAFESPITPHHGVHDDRYLSFEYDHGGWNNVRMGVECLIVLAHAMGRTLVVPPQQHLYLLGRTHKDKDDKKAHDEMGFEDFYDMDKLRSHKGFNIMSMKEFLVKEAVTGGLKVLPPRNSSELWGQELWKYLFKVADAKPIMSSKKFVFSDQPDDFDMSRAFGSNNSNLDKRFEVFAKQHKTSLVYYDKGLQDAHHIHFPGNEHYRLLQHFYSFMFFGSSEMQSFYKRFIRDYMRYKDEIQCAGAELVDLVRKDARKYAPQQNGDFYALHIRRGDLQFKEVKIGARQMVKNLRFLNGTSIIPAGALVYLSTDDPDGLCKGCLVQRKPCETFTPGKKPVGCPEDTSWDAFRQNNWTIRFLRDYLVKKYEGPPSALQASNPNTHGQIESIVCSRATAFAGTYFSTFTGYIHRLRGYHGLAESTYYHSTGHVFALIGGSNTGHGWTREFRAGWTDDGGEAI